MTQFVYFWQSLSLNFDISQETNFVGINVQGHILGTLFMGVSVGFRVGNHQKDEKYIFSNHLSGGGGHGGERRGIFIQTVNPESPLGRKNEIFVGDRILQVNGVSTVYSELHVFADIYKNSTSPVEFVVQPAEVCYFNQS